MKPQAIKSGFSLPVGTVTFLLTDIAGSTRLWQDDPEQAASAIAAHCRVIDEAIARHGGARPQDQGEGDSTFSAFARASDAVAAAVDIQRSLAATPASANLRVRVALHTGEAALRGESNYFGEAVNRCARLRGIAHGGQVLLSEVTSELIRDSLPEQAQLLDLGVHRLKDLTRPEHVFMLCHPDLQSEFPPLTSLDSFPHNLPVQLTSLIPRDAEIAELKGLLESGRLVTVTGSGGCGKTRLALQLAAELLDQFRDGVWFVDLAPLNDPDVVAHHTLAALGLQEGPLQTSVDALRGYLRHRRALIVFDNCEHLINACAELCDNLLRACCDMSILATSREALGIAGEVIWRVPSLSVPTRGMAREAADGLTRYGAVRLYVDRAREARPNFEITDDDAFAVAEICSRLDGIPLAIELAAARTRVMTPQEILRGLEDRFRLLTRGARTALPRHRTLDASVEWSFMLLSSTERIVLTRLAVFVGGFGLDAAEDVCGFEPVSSYEMLDVLTSLVDKSLVQVETEGDHGQYRLLETIREYALKGLLERDEGTAMQSRHMDHYLGTLAAREGALEKGDPEVLPSVEKDWDNIRAAVEWSFSTNHGNEAFRHAWPLAICAIPAGRAFQVKTWLSQALTTADEADPWVRARCLLAIGVLCNYRYETFEGLPLTEQALALFREVEDDLHIGRAAATLAFQRSFIEGITEAAALVEEARAKAQQTSDCLTQMWTSGPLLGVCQMFNDMAEARGHLERAIEIMGSASGIMSPSLWLAFLARIAVLQGRLKEAIEIAGQVLSTPNRDRSRTATAMALTSRGEAQLGLGSTAEAFVDLVDACRISEETQDVGPYQLALHTLSQWELANGDIDAALDTGGRAAALAAFMSPAIRCVAQIKLIRAQIAQGDIASARQGIDWVMELSRSMQLQWPLASVCVLKSRVEFREGDIEGAGTLAIEALRVFQQAASIAGVIESLELLSEIAARRENWDEATRALSCAEALRKQFEIRVPAPNNEVFEPLMRELRLRLAERFDRVWDGGQALDLDRVVEYVTQGQGVRELPSSGWASLTPVELQVAELISEGQTDPQIGERLFISKRTVQGHVSRILAKLSLSSRSEIAAHVAARSAGQMHEV